MKKLLVTGSSGLIGSEVCTHFAKLGWKIYGLDNNQRSVFFGSEGDTRRNQNRLLKELNQSFIHNEVDIRDRETVVDVVATIRPDAIVHTAAQPSHDKAAEIPFEDFDINAVGTLNLLEASKRVNVDVPFVYMSTNKVYGDRPNKISMKELNTRWDYDDPTYLKGISENFSIDQSKHSLFGASKLSADILVQEYGKYFDMPSCCLRAGCVTGPHHAGVKLHGFLSYMVRCNVGNIKYNILGYKGKQVRDNIHSYDVSCFIEEFLSTPRVGEVYNIGGGRRNSCSIWEAFKIIENFSGKKQIYEYNEENRIGDHICYISDLSKINKHYPNWDITISLESIIEQTVDHWKNFSDNEVHT